MIEEEETTRITDYFGKLGSRTYLMLGLFFGTISVALGFVSSPLALYLLILSAIDLALLLVSSLVEQKISRLLVGSVFALAIYYVWSLHASLAYGYHPPELTSSLTLAEQYNVYSLGMLGLGYIIFGVVEISIEQVQERILRAIGLAVIVLGFLAIYFAGNAAIAQSETAAFSSSIFFSLVFVILSSVASLAETLKHTLDSLG